MLYSETLRKKRKSPYIIPRPRSHQFHNALAAPEGECIIVSNLERTVIVRAASANLISIILW